ncbi:MAG: hypothetical protein M3494_11725, partial [Actinomycetota bacterium]|nr:hypothetical protein [Actinomycetota bacterium]
MKPDARHRPPKPDRREKGAEGEPFPGHRRSPDIAVPRTSPFPGHRRSPDIAAPRTSPLPGHRRSPD